MMQNYEEMFIIEIFVKVSICADSELNNDGIFFTVFNSLWTRQFRQLFNFLC